MAEVAGLLDGRPAASIPATDRGLLYGDGLFETLAVCAGAPCLWEAHLRRLRRGARRLGLPCPPATRLRRECQAAIGEARQCVVKLVLTRGSGGRGYRPPAPPQPRRIFLRHPWPDYPMAWRDSGVRVEFCRTRLAIQPQLAGLKHLNRLEQVLARAEWTDAERAEGLMRDTRGRVICGTMSNLFLVSGTRLLTPNLTRCGIRGTVRELVLEAAARFGLTAVEKDLYPRDLYAAEGLFLTNALIGVWPVRQLGDRTYARSRRPQAFLDWLRVAVHQPAGSGTA